MLKILHQQPSFKHPFRSIEPSPWRSETLGRVCAARTSPCTDSLEWKSVKLNIFYINYCDCPSAFWENPTLLQNTADWTDKLEGGQLLQRCLGGNFDLRRHFILSGNKLSCRLRGQEVVNARLIKERVVTSAGAAAPRKLSKHFSSSQPHYPSQVQKYWDSGVSSQSSQCGSFLSTVIERDMTIKSNVFVVKRRVWHAFHMGALVLKRAVQCKCFILSGKEA